MGMTIYLMFDVLRMVDSHQISKLPNSVMVQ